MQKTKIKVAVAKKLLTFLLVALTQPVIASMQTATYRNPIVAGNWADPGIIRVGDDYYSVCSTQGWQPGAHIIHSKDLLNWRYIGYGYSEHSEIPPGRTNAG